MADIILLIEDDVLISRMYQKVFDIANLRVEIANNGVEGLEKAKDLKPKFIVCDVMMPQMNGLEVLERLKADPATKDIPVVMLTNLSGTADAQQALSKGAIAYMVKSEYKPREIVDEVTSLMKSADVEITK